ncbi:MAG TPA: hypothetical protein VFV90_05730 [Usitatibacter sp.]|nr:hypothetical protein [Usitatibacter sp.]
MLDILIPGLLPPALSELGLPHLERWLARADAVREPARSAEGWLAHRFGLEPAPVAAVSLAVDEAPQPGHWLRADPVFARVERDSLVLHHAAALGIGADEARELVASLRAHFAADGLEFHVPRPDRWYVRVPAGEVPATTALPEALGQDVFGRLPRGNGSINWAGALTEAQMLLSTHPVNIAREAARKPPVNAIWFWGEGTLPKEVPARYRNVFASDPFAAGLAHLSGAALAPAPSSPGAIASEGSVLLVLDAAAHALNAGNAEEWKAAALAIDAGWFAEMGGLLKRHGEVRIILPTARDTCVAALGRGARWRLLRRPRPLSTHA